MAGSGQGSGDPEQDEKDDEVSRLRQRLVISAILSLPVLLMSMIPMLQFDNWQWLALTLASPVVVWGALPFHRAAFTNARHGAATMDTLISVGVSSAWLWSLLSKPPDTRRSCLSPTSAAPTPGRRGLTSRTTRTTRSPGYDSGC